MIVSGQTGSGKTHFVIELLKTDKSFDSIILAFSMIQPSYLDLKLKQPNVTLVEGFPEAELQEIIENGGDRSTVLVLDDLMLELENDKRLASLFTKMRHKNVSTIFLVQNLYHHSKYMRTITRNCHYLVIFENPRDAGMIGTLGRQIFPQYPKFLPDAFRQATQKMYGYIFLDLKPETDKRFRVKEGVLSHEQTYIYLPK